VLYKLRQSRFTERDAGYSNIDIYCLVQICYELINVEEESQIVAFYSLITQNTNGEKPNQDEADEKYGQARKLLRAAVSK
jgi:predicted GNAT family N-acyltransferase